MMGYFYSPDKRRCIEHPCGYQTQVEAVEAWLRNPPPTTPGVWSGGLARHLAKKHLNRLRNEARHGESRRAKSRRSLRASTAPKEAE